jgi:hypothetical protein
MINDRDRRLTQYLTSCGFNTSLQVVDNKELVAAQNIAIYCKLVVPIVGIYGKIFALPYFQYRQNIFYVKLLMLIDFVRQNLNNMLQRRLHTTTKVIDNALSAPYAEKACFEIAGYNRLG